MPRLCGRSLAPTTEASLTQCTAMTESHLRRLAVTMQALEDALLEFEAALRGAPDLLMTIYQDDVPVSARPAIQEHIRRLRREIRIVRDRYGVEAELISNRRRISAKLSLLSIDLTEATFRYLRAYGEVPKDEQDGLDEQVARVISLLNDLNKLV